MTSEPSAVGAGAFNPDPLDLTEAGQPARQRRISGARRGERLDGEHAAVPVERGCDMNIQMRVNTARDHRRGFYDGHCHPFPCSGCGVARTSRDGDRVETAALTADSVTLWNGACPI